MPAFPVNAGAAQYFSEIYKGNIIWGADLMEVPLSLAFDNSVA